ncbi:MAG: T9SS type A sorting domain-containing protein [Bacteroidales bacterium]|nr:T9SS type A sorting domain-containing protein [Bacteroidales bacterium]
MRTTAENIKMVVTLLVAALCIIALGASLFAQERNEEIKTERTKIVTLKIVEDENGKITTVDTTFVYNGDDSDDPVFFWNDKNNLQYELRKLDSIKFNVDFESFSFDSIEKSMIFVQSKINDEMKALEKEMEKLHQSFQWADSMETLGMKQFWVTVDDTGKKTNAEKQIKIIKGDNDQIIFVGSPDTTIKTNGQTIMITHGIDDKASRQTKTVTLTTEFDAEDGEEKTITIVVDGDDVDIRELEDGEKIVIVKSNVSVHTTENVTVEELKTAGIETGNGELEPIDLTFAPNPNNGTFNLSFSLKEKGTVSINIFDINGSLVYSETLKDFEGKYNKEIDISGKGTGPFFLQIIQGIYDIVKKIMIQ